MTVYYPTLLDWGVQSSVEHHSMKVAVLLAVFVGVWGDEEICSELDVRSHYLVEGIVQFENLVNFIEPIGDDFETGKCENCHIETRRSDKKEQEEVFQITQEIPVPYPVKIEKTVHYPVPIPVEQPVAIHVPQPYPVRIEKKVPFPVAVPVARPFPVHKTVPVPVEIPVDNPVPYAVFKPVPFYVQRNVPVKIVKHVPLQMEIPVYVNKEVAVPVPVEKKTPFYVPKPVPYEVKIPIEKHFKTEIPVPYQLNLGNPAAEQKKFQAAMVQLMNGANVLFQKSVELSVPSDQNWHIQNR